MFQIILILYLKNKFNIEVSEINEELPDVCWIPTLLNSPTEMRLIIAVPKFSVKPLSMAVQAGLRLMYRQIDNYSFKTRHYSGVKALWLVQSSQSVMAQ